MTEYHEFLLKMHIKGKINGAMEKLHNEDDDYFRGVIASCKSILRFIETIEKEENNHD